MTRKNTEIIIQRELIKWIKQEYPTIEVIWQKNEGKKFQLTAILDKKSGLISGFPDLTLYKPHKGFTYILHLELKTKIGTLNPNQKLWWSRFLSTKNRKGAIAYGLEEAKTAILNWLRDISDTE